MSYLIYQEQFEYDYENKFCFFKNSFVFLFASEYDIDSNYRKLITNFYETTGKRTLNYLLKKSQFDDEIDDKLFMDFYEKSEFKIKQNNAELP